MTSDAILILKTWFSVGWRLFTSFKIPGTNITPLALLIFPVVVGLSLKFLSGILGHGNAGQIGSAVGSYRYQKDLSDRRSKK